MGPLNRWDHSADRTIQQTGPLSRQDHSADRTSPAGPWCRQFSIKKGGRGQKILGYHCTDNSFVSVDIHSRQFLASADLTCLDNERIIRQDPWGQGFQQETLCIYHTARHCFTVSGTDQTTFLVLTAQPPTCHLS